MTSLCVALLLESPLTWWPVLANPDVAVLLLLAGLLLIYAEFNIPGTILPGALGVLCTLLALFSLSLLPISHGALALLLAGLVLLLLEVKLHTHGAAAAVGILALVYGLAHLVSVTADTPNAPHVHWTTAIAAGVAFGGITLGLAWIAMLARRNKFLLGPQAMLDKLAVAKTALAPTGQVEIRGELWQATLSDLNASAPAGASLVVRAVEGLHLTVEMAAASYAKTGREPE